MKRYEQLEHTADLKIQAFGETKEELFANMAIGMFETIIGDSLKPKKKTTLSKSLSLTSTDLEALLVEFLSELVYLSDINTAVFSKYDLRITDPALKGIVRGYAVDAFSTEIKAVTYSELMMRKTKKGWEAIVVFDV